MKPRMKREEEFRGRVARKIAKEAESLEEGSEEERERGYGRHLE